CYPQVAYARFCGSAREAHFTEHCSAVYWHPWSKAQAVNRNTIPRTSAVPANSASTGVLKNALSATDRPTAPATPSASATILPLVKGPRENSANPASTTTASENAASRKSATSGSGSVAAAASSATNTVEPASQRLRTF